MQLCNLCNLSLQSGVFPSCLKQAIVFPRLKKPNLDQDNLSSYRPISNLSFLSKIVERAVVRQFSAYASAAGLFPVRQSAYRPFHSTETAVLCSHNDLVRSIDSRQVAALVLLDLSAAFDTVDHSILLSVLSDRFSVTDTALSWFRSYLSDRTQSFVFANSQTVSHPVDCSVPQGSVFGALGFVAYTEDLENVIKRHAVKSHSFADDTKLYASVLPSDTSSARQGLTDCAADVAAWCASRRLQLNADKTEVIWFGSRANLEKIANEDLTVSIGTESIQPVKVVRDLGVLLDSQLSMNEHITKVAAACFFHLRRLRQIRRRAGPEITTRLVLALIMSRLDYCNSILSGLPQTTLEPMQRVQNAAARLILHVSLYDHVTPCLMQLHWLPIRQRINYKLCTLMFRIRAGQCPSYLSDMVQSVSSAQSRPGLRSASSNTFFVPRIRTKFAERSFSYSGPVSWNSLPAEIRSEQNFTTFKRLLKTYLFTAAFNVV